MPQDEKYDQTKPSQAGCLQTAVQCFCCPRKCAADRINSLGFCGAGTLPRVARAKPHHWEEPMLSGTNGSGAVFFSGCSLQCIFCQNKEISAFQKGKPCDSKSLYDIFLHLQTLGVHNINLVTPTPHILAIKDALIMAKADGLTIPVVYNSGGYDGVEALRELDGLIDIYLPDLKYVSPQVSEAYSSVGDYFEYASKALEEMSSQVGALTLDENGLAKRGLIIRHLVLPGNLDDSRRVLDYIRNTFPRETYISLMRQYTPLNDGLPAALSRKLTSREYERAVDYCMSLGFTNVLIQEKGSEGINYVPRFYDELLSDY